MTILISAAVLCLALGSLAIAMSRFPFELEVDD